MNELNKKNQVDYYDCGQFGDAFCGHCGARLLLGESNMIKRGRRQTSCCANGSVDTEQTRTEFDELQLPPPAYVHGLVDAVEERVREAFLNNIMAFNNTFAFASTHGERAHAEQMGGRMDTCKYNGQFTFLFSDLIAPGVRRPTTNTNDVGLKGLPVGYDFQHQAQLLEEDNILDSFYGEDAGQRRKPPQQVAVEQIGRLNPDQRDAFAEISTSILGGCDQKLFFLEGAGGCGKTYFYNTLIKWCIAGNPPLDGNANSQWVRNQELQRDTVVAAASTGIAALLLIGGGTAHRHFYVPNDVSQETPPMLNFESAKADQLRRAQLIIIDEISMLSNTVLDYIDRLLRDVCANASPFGNKVVLCLQAEFKNSDMPKISRRSRRLLSLFTHSFADLSLRAA
ncbi:hypothetical protein niasHS_013061 [Heterodera schachtii]|uniref:ATP-dependent DNA helicase n=1 Tax=Heterodera schachtii TaxID=97005 RepID=A0ABD2INL4_HETSC